MEVAVEGGVAPEESLVGDAAHHNFPQADVDGRQPGVQVETGRAQQVGRPGVVAATLDVYE